MELTQVPASYHFSQPTKNSNISGGLGAALIAIAVYGVGYGSADKNKAFEPDSSGFSDYSVSNAIANGEKAAISAFIALAMVAILFSLHYRCVEGKMKYLNYFLVIVISSLLISIVYINPLRQGLSEEQINDYDNYHWPLSITAFVLNMIFITIIVYQFYKQYTGLETKWVLVVLALLDIGAFAGCIGMVESAESKSLDNYSISTSGNISWGGGGLNNYGNSFAACENIQIICFIILAIVIGFFPGTGKESTETPAPEAAPEAV